MDIEARLKHIRDVKEFGRDLGLEFKGILSKYDSATKHGNYYFLIVTPPNSLEACVEEESISRNNRHLAKVEKGYRRKGYDTYLDMATAWEYCQVTKKFLKRNYRVITGTVLHEGWHKTSRIEDLALDEAIAGVVDCIGTIEYCRRHDSANLDDARTEYSEIKRLADFITKYYRKLERAYERDDWVEVKPKIMKEAKAERRKMIKGFNVLKKDRMAAENKVNNSYFYFENLYYQHFRFVDRTFRKLGLEEGIKFFKRYSDHERCIRNMEGLVAR